MDRRHEYRSPRTTTARGALFLLPYLIVVYFLGLQVRVGTSRQNVAADAGGGARRRRRIARSGGGVSYSPPGLRRSLNREEEEEDAPASSSGSSARNNNRVDFLYTYGSPSVVAGPHVSNPGNKCGESFLGR